MPIDLSQFYQVFFEESAEHLANMEALLLALDVDNPEGEPLNAIFRAVHSIKGSANTFGFSELGDTAHILENLLDRVRKRELKLRPEMIDAFLAAGDLLRGMLEARQIGGSVEAGAARAIHERLRELAGTGGGAADAGTPPAQEGAPPAGAAPLARPLPAAGLRAFGIEFVPTEISAREGGVERLLDELRRHGELEVLNRPDAKDQGVGFWKLRLTTPAPLEAFSGAIDQVAENGAWWVTEEAVIDIDLQAADFGLFANGLEVFEDNDGYGFFVALADPVGNAPAQADAEPITVVEHDVDYGFLPPPPPPLPPAGMAGEAEPGPQDAPASAAPPASGPDLVPDAAPDVAADAARPAARGDASIRVSIDKVDRLINLLGELVITQAMVQQSAAQMGEAAPERMFDGLGQLERNTRELQESVMSMRMLPISFVFSRFQRLVHDLSAKLGKQAELKTSGEATELDRGLIERIVDPLTHLVRNSLDHGIETPQARLALGKNPVGAVTLKAAHQGGSVVIEVADDGAGLCRDKILAKARQRGLPAAETMSDREVFNLIFEAGFSTAEQVTDVSGRGVGMDVVRRNIQALGGCVDIESASGAGTRISVRLPLTLAILDGISVAVGDQIYVLPLPHVVESLQPRPGDIRTLAGQGRVIEARGEFLPVIALGELLGQPAPPPDFTRGILVIVAADDARAALFVDALVGQHQAVIKSLETNYRRVPGISGATIMGDGRVALILDVPALAGMARMATQ